MPAPKKAAPKKAGRPPSGQPKARNVNTTVPPEIHEWLTQQGSGSASRGMRLMILEAHARYSEREKA
jgi:hypothetical protein